MRMLCYFLRWLQEWDDQSVSSRADISPVPSSLSRWTEEAKLLDGESVHHLVASLKPELEEELKKYRQVEFLERKQRLLAEKKEADKNKPPPAPPIIGSLNSSVGSTADLSQTSSMDSAENGEVTRAFVSAMLGLTSSSNPQQTGRETLNAAASVVADEIVQASLSSAVTAAEATVAAAATTSSETTATSSETTTSSSETMVDNNSGGADNRSKR